MPNPTDETSGLVDDLAIVLEETGVHVEELIEELLEAVDQAEAVAAALQDREPGEPGEPGEVDAYAAARAQAARATSAGLAATGAALRGAWDAVPGLSPARSWAGER